MTSKKEYKCQTKFMQMKQVSILGKNQWVWVFRTAQDILLVIRPSRGNNVLEEIWEKNTAELLFAIVGGI